MDVAYISFGMMGVLLLALLVSKATKLQSTLDEIKHIVAKSDDQNPN
jgi:hypothetical protein